MNAFHWAVNRGQLGAAADSMERPTGTQKHVRGNVLDTPVWSAINEPRPDHLEILEELLKAGARFQAEDYLTGHEQVDAILRRYRSV
jgi:hypothetical protein